MARSRPDRERVRESPPIDSQQKAFLAAQAALAKHAEGVVIMDLRTLSTVTDYFVVCTVDSAPQMTAVRDNIERLFADRGCSIWHTEGIAAAESAAALEALRQPSWVLLDCGDVVVHLFDSAARGLYRLEEMWADAPRLSLPPELTASARETRAAQ